VSRRSLCHGEDVAGLEVWPGVAGDLFSRLVNESPAGCSWRLAGQSKAQSFSKLQ
jgi:hypothetical protein